MRINIYSPIPGNREFYFGIITAITDRLQRVGLELPFNKDEIEYVEKVVPDVLWTFFYRYRPNTNVQKILIAWAQEYTGQLIDERNNCDLTDMKYRFITSKGYIKSQRDNNIN